jgi:hypothetical protein
VSPPRHQLNSCGSHSCELVDDLTAGYAATMEKRAALPEAAIPSMEAVSEVPALPKPQATQEEEDNGAGENHGRSSSPKAKKRKKER